MAIVTRKYEKMAIPTHPDDRAATIIILDRDERRIATLGSKTAPVYDPIFRDAENEAISLTFRTKSDTEEAACLKQRNMVAVEDPWEPGIFRLLEIVEVDQISGDGAPQLEVVCDDQAAIELSGNYVDDIRLYDTDPLDALTRLLGAGDTRWKVGNVNLTGKGHTNVYHESVAEGLKKLSEAWGGIFRFRVTIEGNRITGRYIDWFDPYKWEDYTGVRWETGKNIKNLKKTVISSEVATAIYPYGRGEELEGEDRDPDADPAYGRRIDISDVVWSKDKGDPIDKPKGQKWIGDSEALQRWGYRNGNGDLRHIFHVEIFEDEEDPENLARLGWEKLQEISQEWATYEAEIVDRSRDPRYAHETTKLGTAGVIIDDNFNPPIQVKTRVIAAEVNLNNKRDMKLILGSFIPSVFDEVREIKREVKKKVDVGSPITLLDTTVKNLKDRLRNTVGYKYQSESMGDLWCNGPYGHPETTSYLQIKGGMMAIADRWDSVANEPDWRAFGTGAGFTADMITTGTLNASQVYIYAGKDDTDGSSEITLYDGYMTSYFDGMKTVRVGKHEIEFFYQDSVGGAIYGGYNASINATGLIITGKEHVTITDQTFNHVFTMGFHAGQMVTQFKEIWFLPEEEFMVWTRVGETGYLPLLIFDRNSAGIYLDSMNSPILHLSGYGARIDLRNDHARWVQSPGNYISQNANNGNVYIYVDGTVRHTFRSDGTKSGGSIVIDGENLGMSPIDSPRVLLADTIENHPVNETGVMVELEERFQKALSGYIVIPSRGDVVVSEKSPEGFKVSGPTGVVDLLVVGTRVDQENIYFQDLDDEDPDLEINKMDKFQVKSNKQRVKEFKKGKILNDVDIKRMRMKEGKRDGKEIPD